MAPGTFGQEPLETHDDDDRGRREREGRPADVAASSLIQSHCCCSQFPVPFGTPSMSGIWPDEHLDADTGEEPDQHRCGQEVAEEAQPQQPGE